jgi:hypothetical protein
MLKKLAEIATELDNQGHKDLADKVDELMTVMAAKKGVNPFAKKDKGAKDGKGKGKAKAVFPADHPKVKDKKEHFPLGSAAQARNALARANQFKEVPPWFKGTLKELVSAVAKAVKKEFPSIDVSEKSKKPGKG